MRLPWPTWLHQPSRARRVCLLVANGRARLMGQWLTERLGQQFVIENRPGAGTNIATEAVVRSAPDGYSLAVSPANATHRPRGLTSRIPTCRWLHGQGSRFRHESPNRR